MVKEIKIKKEHENGKTTRKCVSVCVTERERERENEKETEIKSKKL